MAKARLKRIKYEVEEPPRLRAHMIQNYYRGVKPPFSQEQNEVFT